MTPKMQSFHQQLVTFAALVAAALIVPVSQAAAASFVDIAYALEADVTLPPALNDSVIFRGTGEVTIRYATAFEGSTDPVLGPATLVDWTLSTEELDFQYAGLISITGEMSIDYSDSAGFYDAFTGTLSFPSITGEAYGIATCLSNDGLCVLPGLEPQGTPLPFQQDIPGPGDPGVSFSATVDPSGDMKIGDFKMVKFFGLSQVFYRTGPDEKAIEISRTAVPEPTSALLIAMGLGFVSIARRR